MSYTLEKFLDQNNHAPIDLCEVAHRAACVTNDKKLRESAKNYHLAVEALKDELERVGFEFG